MGLSFGRVCGWLVGSHRRRVSQYPARALFNAGHGSAHTEMAPHMATLNSTFHMSIQPDILMPIFIPASDLPEVHLLSPADGAEDGSYTTYDVTKNPDVAHKVALHWLAAERAMRKRASEKEAERLRAEAEKQRRDADEFAAVLAEAKELRKAFYNGIHVGPWETADYERRQRWLTVARESLQRLGKLDRHE